jgi:phage tail sheath gpL-like
MATISIPGIAPNMRVPGGYAHIEFAQGPANAALGPREAVIVAPKTAAGVGTVNTLYEIKSERDAALYAGSGSPAHRCARQYLQHGSTPRLWAVLYNASSAGSAAAAKFSVGITGAPTVRGEAAIQVAADACSYGFSTTDTPSTIGTGLAASVNAKTWLPVTAAAYSSSTGTGVTVTAKVAGTSQNVGIRVRPYVTPSAGIACSAGGDCAGGVEGSTTEITNLTAALATLDAVRKYYIGSTAVGATQLAPLKTHINNKSQPNPGLRSVGICGSRDTLANTTTLANTLNFERLAVAWQEDSDHTVSELVGELMAMRAVAENEDSAANIGGQRTMLNKQYDLADWPTVDEQSTAVNEGISCIASNDVGSYLVMSVNTRSKNSAGTVADFRACESHRVSVCDEFVDGVLRDWALNFQGKKLKDDILDSQGRVDPNQAQSRNVVKPSVVKRSIVKQLRDFEDNEKLQETDASVAGLVVQKSTVNTGRVEARCDLRVIDHAHQFVGRFSEVSPG